MGSPYFVHQLDHRVHVIRSVKGLSALLRIVMETMGISLESQPKEISEIWDFIENNSLSGPEGVALKQLLLAHEDAKLFHKRVVVFLEARYAWRGWEKFQRVIVFDYTRRERRSPSSALGSSETSSSMAVSPPQSGQFLNTNQTKTFVRMLKDIFFEPDGGGV